MESAAIKTRKITKTQIAKKLGVSRQSLYYQHKRAAIDEEIKRQIETVLTENKAYGHKRIALALKLNKKRILRVMKKFNIKPYRRRVKKPVKKEDLGKAAEKAVNIYKLLCPLAPNIVWVSDFTYIKFKGRFIYVATIMDMYTREIIGVAVSRFHDRNLVMEAFMDAESKTGTHPVYLHSDQGSEYTSDEYKTVSGILAPLGEDAFKIFTSHYVIQIMWNASREQLRRISQEGGMKDCFGRWLARKKEVSCRSILAQASQAMELLLLSGVVELAIQEKDTQSFKITLWQHDGFAVQFRHKEQKLYWTNRIMEAVTDKAQELEVPTSLEVTDLTY